MWVYYISPPQLREGPVVTRMRNSGAAKNELNLLSGFHHKDLRSSEMKVKAHTSLHVCTKEELCAWEKRVLRRTFDQDRYHRWESSELLATNKRLFHVRGTEVKGAGATGSAEHPQCLCGNQMEHTNINITLQMP